MLLDMDKILQIKNITKIYGQGTENLTVLNDISLDVEAGKFIVLLGPSGSGKSTLLNLIAMLDTPTNGQILFNGKDLTRLNEMQKSKIRLNSLGFVFQFDSLLPEFTMLENVDMPAVMKGHPNKDKAKKLLEGFGLDKISHKMPSDLSGGEKQRASIARALRNNPKMLLADEPTGNLDAEKKIYVFEDFKRLAKTGVTVIMVTHDAHAVDYADKVYIIESGHLVQKK